MSNIKLLTIVTPNLNGGKYLEETIKSVVCQKNSLMEYIVVDGMSNDRSRSILNKYKKKIDKIIFQKDNSMYQAINTGFKYSNAKYITWINSDDLYYKNSLFKFVKMMDKNKISWANGVSSTLCDGKIKSINFPYYFPRKLILNGSCHKSKYGFIPQESVIFTKKLFKKSNGFKLSKKIGGDFFLWKSFAKYENLVPINLKLGIFRKRKGQLSENLNNYYSDIGTKYKKRRFNFLRIFYSFFYLIAKYKL